MKNKVLIAMSGGIDSAISAILLKDKGYDLIGCTYFTGDYNKCAVSEAKKLANKIGINHISVDLTDIFNSTVIDNFIHEYSIGHTPNPCVICNAKIKFDILWNIAKDHGCDYLATGHYARIEKVGEQYFVKKAIDEKKDQSYFLWNVKPSVLEHILFPLGDLTKFEVRQIAKTRGYIELSEKKESQDICFIPNNDYRGFLCNHGCICNNGNYIDNNGNVIGTHNGVFNYTVGQRKGLGIAFGHPVFVKKIDIANNTVTLCNHDELYTKELQLPSLSLRIDTNRGQAKIRYNTKPVNITINNGTLIFDDPVWGITPGQSCVIYNNDLVIGGGIIQ